MPKSDSEILRKERQQALIDLIRVGNRMSNLLFNLKQKKLTDFTRLEDGLLFIAPAGELQHDWDEATRRLRDTKEKA
jgi:hypothetical protein